MTKEIILLLAVLAPVVFLAVLLLRKARRHGEPSLKMDFRKAKEHERRKNTDLSAYP